MAAQEQALQTNQIKAKIDKTQKEENCGMCGTANETVNHIVSECSKLAQKEYKRRHGWEGKKIRWELGRKFEIDVTPKWYQHEPEAVTENEKCKILWDVSIQMDHVMGARRPDMIVVDNKYCEIAHFAIPYDSKIELKEQEKIEKYQDLRRELKKIWNMKVNITPIVIGAMGAIPKKLRKRLEQLGIKTRLVELQKNAILYTARILRKVVEI